MNLDEAIDRFFAGVQPKPVRGSADKTGCILMLSGSLDLGYSKQLLDLLTWVVDAMESKTLLLVDLSAVNYISSTGVGALSTALIMAKRRDLEFKLRGLQPKVRSVFDLLGLLKFFEVVELDA